MYSSEMALDEGQLARDSEWLRTYLQKHTGEDRFFNAILGRAGLTEYPVHATTSSESDRLGMFGEIVEYLTELCGGPDAASEWLFRNTQFEKTGKASPFEFLEDGEFDVLWLLHSCLQMSVRNRLGNSEKKEAFVNPLEAVLPEINQVK